MGDLKKKNIDKTESTEDKTVEMLRFYMRKFYESQKSKDDEEKTEEGE